MQTSQITEEQKEELFALVGENEGYYEAAWFGADGTKFNWVAFFFSLLWLIYRKMYGVAGLFFVANLIGGGVLSIFLPDIVITVLASAICGFLGNRWYFKHVHRKVALVQSKEPDKEKRLELLKKRGGVNLGGATAVGFIGLVLVILSTVYSSPAASSALHTLTGHRGWVYAIAFSPDGQRLASGGGDHAVKLWDVANGSELRTLAGHTELVGTVDFSPDGRLIAAGSSGLSLSEKPRFEVRIWEASSGREINTLPHPGGCSSLVFSPDGNLLAGSDGSAIKLYEVATWKEIQTLPGHKGQVTGVAFSPNSKLLATWSQAEDNTVKLWEVSTGTEVRSLEAHPSRFLGVMAAGFSPDGRWLAAANDQKEVKIREVQTGQEAKSYKGRPEGMVEYVESATISRDGRWLVTEARGAVVELLEITSGRIHSFVGHKGQPGAFTFSLDGKLLASSGGQDNTIKLWRVPTSTGRSIWPAEQ